MKDDRLVVLILGGYGTFGGRIARLLSDDARLTLVIAGRSLDRANAFCRNLAGAASAIPLRLDRREVPAHLARSPVDLLVDASGPFQAYGSDPYGVVEACIATGVHYTDLADATDFTDGIVRFDHAARKAGVFALSGMSSFPVLTAAVVDELAEGFGTLDSVTGGIAPSPYAGVGLNVIRAIASYAGQPLRLRRAGRDVTAYALTESLDVTIAVPGHPPLRRTRFSLVAVPDLQVLARRRPALADIWMGAGPVPDILHRALNGLSWLVRWRVLPSLSGLAPLISRVTGIVRWGEHRGGMFVRVTGRDADGRDLERSWHLVAEGDDGPLIPSMAVEALVRGMLAGRIPAVGARTGDGELRLGDYDALFSRRSIVTGWRSSRDDAPDAPLFHRVLGESWCRLPAAVRALHGPGDRREYRGRARVRRGRGLLAFLVATLFGFPGAADDVPVRVRISADRRDATVREMWTRDFANARFRSTLGEGRSGWAWLITERFGPLTVGLAPVVGEGTLDLLVRRWSFLGIPLPLSLAPGGHARESEAEGRFVFDIEISHPLVGLIVGYGGWLEPAGSPDEATGRSAGRGVA